MAAYLFLSALIFLIVSGLHLARLIRAAPIQIGAAALPMWISWIGLFITLGLGVWGLITAIRLCP